MRAALLLLPTCAALLAGCPSYEVVACVDDGDCDGGRTCDADRHACLCASGGADPTLLEPEVLAELALEGNWANSLALSADGCTMWVSSWEEQTLIELDAMSGAERQRIPLPILPHTLLFTGTALLIGEDDFDDPPASAVYELDPGNGHLTALSLGVPIGIRGLALVSGAGGALSQLYAYGRATDAGDNLIHRLLPEGEGLSVDELQISVPIIAGQGLVLDGVLYAGGTGPTASGLLGIDLDDQEVHEYESDGFYSGQRGVALSRGGDAFFLGLGDGGRVARFDRQTMAQAGTSQYLGDVAAPECPYLMDLTIAPDGHAVYVVLTDGEGHARVVALR